MGRKKILVLRGETKISNSDILQTDISTCVSVCFYHPIHKIGGITHISRSRKEDTTPSGKYLKTYKYYYADRAIQRVLYLLKKKHNSIREKNLEVVVIGGLKKEGPVSETLLELNNYNFKRIRYEINQNVFRQVRLYPVDGIITITRKVPCSGHKVKDKIEIIM